VVKYRVCLYNRTQTSSVHGCANIVRITNLRINQSEQLMSFVITNQLHETHTRWSLLPCFTL